MTNHGNSYKGQHFIGAGLQAGMAQEELRVL
ncbi:hypothetical protein T11_5699 [Trichinella zimbabwensis]|uniref:Uncharacterized protein n=1 Tax=Trichinella zimbabwensis TaxID=268475 RepID=A0A0V1F5H1_9BILA|nr:hypothetical protein T11_5699 [Trichinella zimbabwensis]